MLFLVGAGLLPALGVGFRRGFGLPLWLLSFLKKRRENKFLNAFPDAVDVIVRGIKAGLPLLDCLKIIAAEAPEPVKSEFRADRRDPDHRHAARRGLRQALRAHAAAGGQFLRHRDLDPAEGRRQPVRSARQPVEGAARPQEDEGQDPGDVDGGQGLGGDHRLRCRSASVLLVYLTSPDYIELLWTTDSAASCSPAAPSGCPSACSS